MFERLVEINTRPEPWEFYTARELWTDEHVSKMMLELHLDESSELASRSGETIDRCVAWMAGRFGIGAGSRVCDFGCGPGLYTSRLARLGAQVTGLDFSKRSIDYARGAAEQEGLSIDYRLQDYLEFAPDQSFDLLTLVYLDYCALSPDQRRCLLDVFGRCLADGGALVLDVLTLAHFEAVLEEHTNGFESLGGFWSPGPYYEFKSTFKYDHERLILHKHSLVEPERTQEMFNWLQCYSLESLCEEFEAGGFWIDEHFADLTGEPTTPESAQLAVIARKKAG